jgi:hypothetical protein
MSVKTDFVVVWTGLLKIRVPGELGKSSGRKKCGDADWADGSGSESLAASEAVLDVLNNSSGTTNWERHAELVEV